jgi:hypothetical protein
MLQRYSSSARALAWVRDPQLEQLRYTSGQVTFGERDVDVDDWQLQARRFLAGIR